MPANLSSLSELSVETLKGVGPAVALKLQRVGIETIQDLLVHLPLRYQDRTRVLPIGSLRAGDEAVIVGEVKAADVVMGRRRSLICRIQDGTGLLTLRFFHFTAAQKNSLTPGTQILCFGEARLGNAGLELIHPEYKRVTKGAAVPVDDCLTPIYPTTEGLSQNKLRSLIALAMDEMQSKGIDELLPPEILSRWRLPSLADAIRALHAPSPDADQDALLEGRDPMQRRLAFEELLAHHLSLLQLREQTRASGAPVMPLQGHLIAQFKANLPFGLTNAQARVSQDVAHDLGQPYPMLRLVQGDVGSGKTVVAALAVLQAVETGYQAAVMAPTEILAEQHYHNFTQWCEPLGIKVAWLAGKLKGKKRVENMEAIADGSAQVVVGTHALFQDDVRFGNLGLVVVDEQHRFGVHQRLSLKEKGRDGEQTPHQLIMTATPIPRTLTMSAYADLDCSIIDELPPGRTPVQTVVMADSRRDEVIERVRSACASGRQVYWVCTLVEESEVLQCQAAEAAAELLQSHLSEQKVGLVHGRMKPAEKSDIMARFKAKELDVLVATTVIEVGVDVPNASVMIIENPERLGLAQLHQLRGRVGRGGVESFCVLMYHAPLSKQGKARLAVMRETTDGFKIAEKDLELRGPGEVLGTRQTGSMQFKIADLQRDGDLLPKVKEAAQALGQRPEHASAMMSRWLGHGSEYGTV
ncbi:MAG: ATP-dependent DNA helicase RecG [Pontibacterium sp.]